MDWCLMADSGELVTYLVGYAWLILKVAIGLGLVIFVHELGHFVAAKACGVKCEKFYIGFDIPMHLGRFKLPSALCKFQWGETEYGVGILPLGGYVKMLGQDDNPANQKRESERIKVRVPQEGAPVPAPVGSETQPPVARVSDPSRSGIDRPPATQPMAGGKSPPVGSETQPPSDAAVQLDPRSFPAKPVIQRMIIISAGVCMNMVFAVIFAAVAYRAGVVYTPCLLGGTTPGDPAWVAGLRPEDQIVQIGREDRYDEHLRFREDLIPRVMLNGGESALEFLVRRGGQSQAEWISLRPTNRLQWSRPFASLGVISPTITRLPEKEPVWKTLADEEPYQQLRGGDEIVAVDGVALPRLKDDDAILAYHLDAVLAQRLTKPLTLRVLRRPDPDQADGANTGAETFDVVLPPRKMRVLGLAMKPGPIVGVRAGSPADAAGFLPGDVLLTMNGKDLGDPLTLSQRLLDLVDKPVAVTVRREGTAEPVALHVTPRSPTAIDHAAMEGVLLGLDALGVALIVENVVAAVESDSPAAKQGLRPGDEIVQVRFVAETKEAREKAENVYGKRYDQPIELSRERTNWTYVHSSLQTAIPELSVAVTYRRDGKDTEVRMQPATSRDWYAPERGLIGQALSRVRTAESWGEAYRLGLRETKEKSLEVVKILKRLGKGQISVKSLGGPLAIIGAAGSEASKGIPSLLIFLTLLSANLAVLNILPIPVLDGGHLVFLLAEGIRGKPVNERLQLTLTLIGFALLLALMLLVCTQDVFRLWFR